MLTGRWTEEPCGRLVVMPGTTQRDTDPPQCFVSSMPDEVDRAACVYDTGGLNFGRLMKGLTVDHTGIKVLIRDTDYRRGSRLADAVATLFDEVFHLTVRIECVSYYVQSVYRVGTVLSLGEEVGKKRQLWSINARVAMQGVEPQPVELSA